MANWGKVIGGVAAVAGASVLGIGLGGEAIAEAMPAGGLGEAVGSAAEHINSSGEVLASKIGLEGHGKAVAATIAGATIVTGAAVAMKSSADHDDHSKKYDEATEEQLKDIRRRMRMQMQEKESGTDLNGDGVIGGAPPPPDRGDGGRGA